MPRKPNIDRPYLIAEPSGFPGVKIPLLSDEECRVRGIEPGRFPPRETWTQQQRDAADKLVEILFPHVFLEALQVVLTELEREPTDPTISEKDQEQAAARRGIEIVDSGKWKQRDTWLHFPRSWVREVLVAIASGVISVVDLEAETPRRGSGGRRKGVR